MKLIIEIDEARFKDIQRIAEVQLEMSHFQTAEQIIAKGVPLEQEPKFVAKADGSIEQIKKCDDCLFKKEWEKIGKLISAILERQTDLCNMTNGEVMQAAFPNNEFISFPYGDYVMYEDESKQNIISFFPAKWWNAPYKEIQRW